MMRTTLIWGSLILGVVPFLSHSVVLCAKVRSHNSMNGLNLGLQGFSATIFNVRDKSEAMIKKLELFSVFINKDNTCVFPSLYDFCVQMNSSLRTMSNVI